MPASDVLKSISKDWPYSKNLSFNDEGYFVNPEMSDDGSDNGREATVSLTTRDAQLPVPHLTVCFPQPSAIQRFLSGGWLPGLLGQYQSSAMEANDGYEGDDEHDADYTVEPDDQPSETVDDVSTSSASDGESTTDETPSYKMPGAFEVSDSDAQTTDREYASDTEAAGDIATAENESLKSQLATQNPWRTLARFRNPMKQEDIALYSRFPILRMPAELLLVVAEHLSTESVACLALACKATYKALGTRSFRMPKANLWNFLLLIEKERQNSYACCLCLKLHRPAEVFSSFSSRRNCNRRRNIDITLPSVISPGLIKMIGRKFFEDPRVFQEYLSWATMADKKTTRHVKVSVHVIPRMLDGTLLLRTETYIHPFHKGDLTDRSFMELTSQIGMEPGAWRNKVPRLCSHQKWDSHFPHLSSLQESVETTKCVVSYDHNHFPRCYGNKVFDTAGHGLQLPIKRCALIHEQPCRACKPDPEGIYGGDIKGCTKCTTDFAISAREVPGVGYCVVLTSWKDIGGVKPGSAGNWDLHVSPRRLIRHRDEEHECRSKGAIGRIYRAYENTADGMPGSDKRYRPQPDQKMVRDLTRKVEPWRNNRDRTTDTEAGTGSEEDGEGRFELW